MQGFFTAFKSWSMCFNGRLKEDGNKNRNFPDEVFLGHDILGSWQIRRTNSVDQ